MRGDELIFRIALLISFLSLSLALLLVLVRLILGPTLPDRVIALDLSAIIAVAFVCVFTISVEQPIYLDMAIALALIAFLGTVAFSQYLFQSQKKDFTEL